ncbi:MAG: cytochrome c biogenesis protein CcsA [Bryobacteraceae bacterium]|nr:cytochrome c biogenesis protein CcsA [Bryobacteraceae bacterium]
MREKLIYLMGLAAALMLVRNLYVILLGLPDEADQGAIYRIIFFHVPSWFTAFGMFVASGTASALYLARKKQSYDELAVATTEVGTVFVAIGLVTGMIWARIIWGIWWTWDPRLTWALITWLVYAGYLMLRRAIDDPTARAKNSAVLNIFSFTSVMITYKAIDWWRTQHPAPVLSIRGAGGAMDPAMEQMLYLNWLPMLMIAIILVMIRMRQEGQQREIESLRRMAHAV